MKQDIFTDYMDDDYNNDSKGKLNFNIQKLRAMYVGCDSRLDYILYILEDNKKFA